MTIDTFSHQIHPKAGQGYTPQQLSSQIRQSNRKSGIKLARKKFIHTAQQLHRHQNYQHANTNGGECDFPPCIYHRSQSINTTSTNRKGAFGHVAFLSPTLIVAVDSISWDLDVIRILPSSSMNSNTYNEMNDNAIDLQSSRSAKSRVGKLVQEIQYPSNHRTNSITYGGSSDEYNYYNDSFLKQQSISSFVKVQNLNNGHAFLAGFPNGSLQMFTMERNGIYSSLPMTSLTKPRSSSQTVASTFSSRNHDSNFRLLWQCNGINRKYARHFTNPQSTLHKLFAHSYSSTSTVNSPSFSTTTNTTSYLNWYEVLENPNNDASSFIHHHQQPQRQKLDTFPKDSIWDFRQFGSSILVLNIHPSGDCFTFHNLDKVATHYSPQKLLENNHNSLIHHNESIHPLICIDTKSRDDCKTIREDITGVCFVGDYTIATSHLQCAFHASTKNNNNEEPRNSVKFWDIRKLSGVPTGEKMIYLEAFPDTKVVGGIPFKELNLDSSQLPECNDLSCRTNLVITGLRGSKENNRLCLSLEPLSTTQTTEPQHLSSNFTVDQFMDSITLDFDKCIKVTSSNKNTDRFPPLFSEDLEYLGRYVIQNDSMVHHDYYQFEQEEGKVLFYDTSSTKAKSENYWDEMSYSNTNPKKKRKQQSPQDRTIVEGYSKDCGFVGEIPIKLHDEDNLISSPSCFAFDEYGSSLLCASHDNGLFLWQ